MPHDNASRKYNAKDTFLYNKCVRDLDGDEVAGKKLFLVRKANKRKAKKERKKSREGTAQPASVASPPVGGRLLVTALSIRRAEPAPQNARGSSRSSARARVHCVRHRRRVIVASKELKGFPMCQWARLLVQRVSCESCLSSAIRSERILKPYGIQHFRQRSRCRDTAWASRSPARCVCGECELCASYPGARGRPPPGVTNETPNPSL